MHPPTTSSHADHTAALEGDSSKKDSNCVLIAAICMTFFLIKACMGMARAYDLACVAASDF